MGESKWEQARRRPGRLRPSHLPTPLRVVAISTWIVAGITLAFGFISDVFKPQEHILFDGQLTISFIPLWRLMCGIAVGSGAAAVGFVFRATRRDAPRHHVLLAWVTGVALPALPVLLLARNRLWQTIPVALAWLAAVAMVIGYVHIRRRAPSPWLGLALACLVAVGWTPLIYINLRVALALSGTAMLRPEDVLPYLATDISTDAFVVSFSIAFVAVMTAAAVALAAHSRSSLADRLQRRRSGWRLTAVLCLVAVAVIVVETSGIGGISSGFAQGYWGLRSFGTWPHAVIVALAITYMAQRSWRTPLQQRGDVSATIIVGVSALAGSIVLAIVATISLVAGAVAGSSAVFAPPEHLHFALAWLALAALVPMALRPAMRGTAGQWVAWIALLYLVPTFAPVTAIQLGHDVPLTFWATPAQVAISLTLIGCGATLLGLLGRPSFLSADVARRVVLIPLLIVAGTSWLPTVIATPLTPVIAVVAALFTLLWAMPPVAADPERHSGVVLTASAQLLLVAVGAVIAAVHAELQPGDPTLSLLFFAVPLSALLCARVTSVVSPASPDTPSTSTSDDAGHMPTG